MNVSAIKTLPKWGWRRAARHAQSLTHDLNHSANLGWSIPDCSSQAWIPVFGRLSSRLEDAPFQKKGKGAGLGKNECVCHQNFTAHSELSQSSVGAQSELQSELSRSL